MTPFSYEKKNINKKGEQLDIDEIVEALVANEDVIKAWNATFTCSDAQLDKRISMLSRTIENVCLKLFDIAITVF